MSGLWVAVLAVAAAAVGAAKATLGGLIQEEASTRLNRIPFALIKMAASRVPDEVRAGLAAEWTAELQFVLLGTEGMPLTRLWRGVRYSAGLLLSARLVADGLRGTNRRSIRRRTRTEPSPEPSARPEPSHAISPRQVQILQVIRDSIQRTGHAPSYREIAEAVGVTSQSTVEYHLSMLVKKGYIRRDKEPPPIRLPG